MKKPRLAEVWQGAVNHQYVVYDFVNSNYSVTSEKRP